MIKIGTLTLLTLYRKDKLMTAKKPQLMDKFTVAIDVNTEAPQIVEGFITSIGANGATVEITTTGVTAGQWDPSFKDRGDISGYDVKTIALKKATRTKKLFVFDTFDTVYEKAAYMIAASQYSSFGAANGHAWLGSTNGAFYACYVWSDGYVSNDYRHSSLVVAPAFNLKISDIRYDKKLGSWAMAPDTDNLRQSYREDITMTIEQLRELIQYIDEIPFTDLKDIIDHLHIAEDKMNG